jgi:hypothetical protein
MMLLPRPTDAFHFSGHGASFGGAGTLVAAPRETSWVSEPAKA